MKLPLLISVPHAGLEIPPEVASNCRLSQDDIIQDGDEGAAEICDMETEAEIFVTTPVARAIIDLNRPEDDRRQDGVVKTHTCWNVPVYDAFPSEEIVETLLRKYYRPYHERLSEAACSGRVRLGVDCHTMAAQAPPIDPLPGTPRPEICLGDLEGKSLPPGWMRMLVDAFQHAFGFPPAVNEPFKGGYITQAHHREMPWVQIEFSRASFMSEREKRACLLNALSRFCRALVF